MDDIVITIERTPTQAAIYSDEPGITVIRDAHVTDRELLLAYADSREEMQLLQPARATS